MAYKLKAVHPHDNATRQYLRACGDISEWDWETLVSKGYAVKNEDSFWEDESLAYEPQNEAALSLTETLDLLENGCDRKVASYLLESARARLPKVLKDRRKLQKFVYSLGIQWATDRLEDWELPVYYLSDLVPWDNNLYGLYNSGVEKGAEESYAQEDQKLPVNFVYLDQRYLADFAIPATKAVVIQSPKNTGKTTWLKDQIPDKGAVVLVGHRKTLLRTQAEALGLAYYEDCKGKEGSRISITFDSLHKLDFTKLVGCTLVLDEFSQGLKHLTGSTLKDQRAKVIEDLLWLLRSSSKVICLDADTTSEDVKLLTGVISPSEITWVANQYKAGDRSFHAHPSTQSLLKHLKASLAQGLKVSFASDRAKEATAFTVDLKSNGYNVLLVTSDTVDSPEVQKFIADPTLAKGYDALVFSPSLGTGFDLNFPYFDTQYLYGTHLTATELHQMSYRVRQIYTNEVHCFIKNLRDSDLADLYKDNDLPEPSSYTRDIEGNKIPLNPDLDSFYNQLWLYKKTECIKSCSNLKGNFYLQAAREGYAVKFAEETKGDKVDLRAHKAAREEAEIEAILAAPNLQTLPDGTQDKAANTKYWLSRNIHKEPESLTSSDIAQYLRDPKAATRWLDLSTPEKLLSQADLRKNDGRLTLDQQDRLGTAKALKAVLEPLSEGRRFLGFLIESSSSAPQVDQSWLARYWGKVVLKHKAMLKSLGVTVDHAKLAVTLRAVLRLIGLEMVSKKVKGTRFHLVCPEALARMQALNDRGLQRHIYLLEIADLKDRQAKGYEALPSFDEVYLNDWLAEYQEGHLCYGSSPTVTWADVTLHKAA